MLYTAECFNHVKNDVRLRRLVLAARMTMLRRYFTSVARGYTHSSSIIIVDVPFELFSVGLHIG